MTANDLLIALTDLIGEVIYPLNLRKYWRPYSDLRLVFYHGIGNNGSSCLRYLKDETPIEIFNKQIDFLLDNYTILSLSDSLRLMSRKDIPNTLPICSISFDDGLSSVYTKAFPLLKNKNIPATVFLNTTVVDNKSMTWLHSINYLNSEFGIKEVWNLFHKYKAEMLPSPPIDEINIQNWYKKYYEINFETKLLAKVFNHLGLTMSEIAKEQKLYLTWDQINEMEKNGFTFCSHTQNHTPLACFTNEHYLENEIKGAYDVLYQKQKNLEFVSFPFGMSIDYGEKAVQYALIAGHKYVLEVGNGTNDLLKVRETNLLARVCLGNVSDNSSRLYSAIELRPKIKSYIKTLLSKR
jgi:peptidoglycan/xylan/chitin deacetylase (PgdA/CDA1 family)